VEIPAKGAGELMLPQLIKIGDFFIPTYGVLVTAGFLLGLWVAARLATRSGLNSDAVVNLGISCALAGIVGAKLLMLIFDFRYYSQNPREIFSLATLQAGGVFQGGLILAVATAFVIVRRNKLPGLATADVLAPGVALGHAIGRLGCFSAGCCWGIECHLPWAVTFRNPVSNQLFGTPLNIPLHPTQLYEAGAEALIFGLLYRRFLRPHRAGTIIALYLVLYSSVRFLVEFIRDHDQPNPFDGPLSSAQWIALATLAAGVWLLARKPASKAPLPAPPVRRAGK
jgi:phosphatidylglycerol:prolipoprotein diacylglycerol transferase